MLLDFVGVMSVFEGFVILFFFWRGLLEWLGLFDIFCYVGEWYCLFIGWEFCGLILYLIYGDGCLWLFWVEVNLIWCSLVL